MKDLFRNFFRYQHYYNQQFLDIIEAHEAKVSKRSLPLFSHNVDAHLIWNIRINGEHYPVRFESYPLEEIRAKDKLNLKTTLKIIEEKDLNESITYTDTQDNKYTHSIRDILFHVQNHTSHHRGMIISDLRQMDIAPIPSDYIYYVRKFNDHGEPI